MTVEKPNNDTPFKCECGKMLAFWRGGKLYVKCKQCKRETEVILEPRTQEVRGH